jgi:HD-GYP domain-containing protein (c-di-GMP phosphodiesterase class II)
MAFIPTTIEGLRIGLYIKLECSWWNHPFAKSKFKITSRKEIKTLKGIPKVKLFYDPDLSDPEEESELETVPSVSDTAVGVPTQEDRDRDEEAIRKEQIHACEEHTAEIQKASYLYQQVFAQTKIAMKRISDGHAAGIKSGEQLVQSLIHSLNKPETAMAMIDILAFSKADDPFMAHALNVCIVSLLVGKEYDLDDDELYALGLAGLLHDLGKQNYHTILRTKRSGLTKGEQQEWLGHPDVGKGAAERFPSAIPAATVQAIYQHHERLDGSGFPLGLQGDEISLFARVVMAADEYDHLCHHENQEKSLTPAEALPYLYDKYIMFPVFIAIFPLYCLT